MKRHDPAIHGRCGDKDAKACGVDVRQVHREHEQARRGGGGERGGEGGQRAAVAGVADARDVIRHERVVLIVADGEKNPRRAGLLKAGQMVQDEWTARDGVGQEGLVAAHARGAAAGEQDGGKLSGRAGRGHRGGGYRR